MTDRRVEKTRQALREAFQQLLVERGYDDITVGEIVAAANVGRTTFYAHYSSKEDLFLDSHEQISEQLSSIMGFSEDLLAGAPAPGLSDFLGHLAQNLTLYFRLKQSSAWSEIATGLQRQMARYLVAQLQQNYPEHHSDIPVEALAQYLASAQFGLISWWIEERVPFSHHDVAMMIHELRKTIIKEILHLTE